MTVAIRREFVDTSFGQMHVATCGDPAGVPVLLLHQTPRSWREWAEVMLRLGPHYRTLAVDTPGMGDSVAVVGEASIELWAEAMAEVLFMTGVGRAHVVGHHTGGVIAVALAAQHPSLVRSLVLSSTPFTHEAFRRVRAERPPIDPAGTQADGSHLAALWQGRQGFYPPDRPDLLHAFVADALKVDDPELGHRAVGAYRMEDAIGKITQPVLLLRAGNDPFASGQAIELLAALPDARMVDIAAGTVPLPDHLPQAVAAAIIEFLGDQP